MSQVLPSSISPGISALADAIAGYGANKAEANYRQAQMYKMEQEDKRAERELQLREAEAKRQADAFGLEQTVLQGQADQLGLSNDFSRKQNPLLFREKQQSVDLEDARLKSLGPTATSLTDAVVSNVERKMPEFNIKHLLEQGGSGLPQPSNLPGADQYDTGMDYGGYGSTAAMDLIGERDQYRRDVRDQVGQFAANEVLSNKDLDAAKWIEDQTKAFGAGAGEYRPMTVQEKAEYGIDPKMPAQIGADGKIDVIENAGGAGSGSIKDPFSITKEFNGDKQVQALQVSASTLNSMYKSFTDPSAISDYDFIYGVAKLLDPNSVVRGSEGDQIVATQALPAQLAGRLRQYATGSSKFDMKTRADLYRLAERRVKELQAQVGDQRAFYGNVATQNGYDPATYVPALPAMPEGSIGYDQNLQAPANWQRGQPLPGNMPPAAVSSGAREPQLQESQAQPQWEFDRRLSAIPGAQQLWPRISAEADTPEDLDALIALILRNPAVLREEYPDFFQNEVQ